MRRGPVLEGTYASKSFDYSGTINNSYSSNWCDSGNRYFILKYQTPHAYFFDASTPYDISTLSVDSGNDKALSGDTYGNFGWMKEDGTRLIWYGYDGRDFNQWDLSTPFDLDAVDFLDELKVDVGYSDHTEENYTAIHAASVGACMIERHVKLENFKSVDSFFSSTISNFAKMIKVIRMNEKSNGIISYKISKSSKPNLNGRKSLYIVKNIKKGEKFSEKNIRSIRPTYGLHPKYLKFFLNKKSKKDIKFGTRLKWSHLKKI